MSGESEMESEGVHDIQTANKGGGWSIITFPEIPVCAKQRWEMAGTAYINLPAAWKASRQSTHSRGPLSATLITLMAGNINVLTLSAIFPVSLGSFRVQIYCVNMPAVVMFLLLAFVFLSASYLRAAADEWEALFIVIVFGNLALMIIGLCSRLSGHE